MADATQRRRLEGDTVQLGPQFREATFDRSKIDLKARTAEMTFSSTLPYQRYWGTEILDHSTGAMDLSRLNNGGALLVNHDWADQVGVIEKAWNDGKNGRATVRFSRSTRGQEMLQDVQDGIRSLVSVGYQIDEMRLESTKGDTETYLVEKWTPYEVSLVAVPADPSVGIGRESEQGPMYAVRVHRPASATPPPKGIPPKEKTMDIQVLDNAQAGASAETQPGAITADTARKLEQARTSALARLGEQHGIDARTIRGWIDTDLTVDQAAEKVLAVLEERGKQPEKTAISALGMSQSEVQGYSIIRMAEAVATQNYKKAGLEVEAHQTIAKRLGKMDNDPRKFFVPLEVQQRNVAFQDPTNQARALDLLASKTGRRDLTVATGSAGGFLVQTTNVGFIEILRNISVAFAMGARRLGGLRDAVTVPRQTGAATAYWLANEATNITESQQTIGQLTLTPKNVGAYTEISRQLTLQSSPDAESLVMTDLAAVVALAVDVASLNGSGASGQPTGIINTAGIGSVSGTSLAYAGMLNHQAAVAGANVNPVRGGYVTTPTVAALLAQRVKFTSTASPLWDGSIWMANACGFQGMSSQQVPASNLIFGDWDKLLIAEWGVLEVEINPYAGFTAGIIGVRAMYTVDIGVRYAGAFSLSTSVT